MDNSKSFENWFEDQVNRGLVDIKLTVTPRRGMTNEAVKNELLVSESMIDAGYVREFPPHATSVIPREVMEVIRAARI